MSVSHDVSPLIRPRSRILTRFGRELNWGDFVFRRVTALLAVLLLAALAAMAAAMVHGSAESLSKFGLGFITSQVWDPVRDVYGALPFIYGTIASSLLALFFAVPISIGVAIFLSELAPAWLRGPVGFLVELLAAVPSVVYGLWGIFVLAPWLRTTVEPALGKWLGVIPLFQWPPFGIGMLCAGMILAIMITPTISAICREVFRAIPQGQRESALALGATRWEMMSISVLS